MLRKNKFVITFLMLLFIGVLPTMSSKAEIISYERYEDFIYTAERGIYGGVQIVNYKGNAKHVVIPEQIDGREVREVIKLKDAKKMKSIYIPKTVRNVRLAQAPALKKVTIAKDNKWCSVYKNFVCNKKRTVLISGLGGYKKAVIPNKIKRIRDIAFSGSQLEIVVLGKNVTYIGSNVFSYCRKLKSVKLNQKLRFIDGYTFKGCKSLKEIEIPLRVKVFYDDLFSGCKKLEKVTYKGTRLYPLWDGAFTKTKKGISFHVKNKKIAKKFSELLVIWSGVKKAKIYVGDTLVYDNINTKYDYEELEKKWEEQY